MKEVLRKLDAIQSTVTDVKKIALLREFIRHDELFKKVVILGTSDTTHFSMKVLPRVRHNDSGFTPGIDREKILIELFYHLDYMSKNTDATENDKIWVAKLADNLEYGRIVVNRILEKRLKCRVTSRSVNKAMPGLVESLPKIQSSKESSIKNISFPAMCEEECRGMYFSILVENKKVRYLSMFGIEYNMNNKKLDKSFIKISRGHDIALMGFGRFFIDKSFVNKGEKAMFKRFLRGGAPQEYHDNLIFFINEILPIQNFWDGKCNVDLSSRYNSKFFRTLDTKKGRVRLPERKIVNSYEEAAAIATELINQGGIGVILKNLNSFWKDRRSLDWVEIRKKVKCTLQIVGIDEENLYCQSSDGFIKCMIDININDLDFNIGSSCDVEFSEIISKRNKVAKSLFMCKYIGMSSKEPNTIDEIKNLRKIAKTR